MIRLVSIHRKNNTLIAQRLIKAPDMDVMEEAQSEFVQEFGEPGCIISYRDHGILKALLDRKNLAAKS